jgi:hypothetical protein
VAHGYILHETLADVEKFHVAADKITKSSEDIPTKELLAIVKKGKAMVVWLPEMPQLEQVLITSITENLNTNVLLYRIAEIEASSMAGPRAQPRELQSTEHRERGTRAS